MTTTSEEIKKSPNLIQNMKLGWSSLSKTKQIIVGAVLGTIVVGGIAYGVATSSKSYVSLYSDLDVATAGEIKTALEESGVTDYKIGEGGTSILVPQEVVDQLRMDLAVGGITPTNGQGFELFDNSQLGMTEQERDIMYQRGLEGELQRSIVSLDAVEEARVHLNISEDTIFNRDTNPSTASVILNLKPNQSLSESQVSGIVALISGAVSQLSPENIEVIDTAGNLLTRDQNLEDGYQTGELISKEVDYELRLEEKLQAQLGKVLGHDKIAVSVRVSLETDSEESRSETYEDGALVSQDTTFNRDTETSEDAEGSGPLDNNVSNNIDEGTLEDALNDGTITDFNQSNDYQPSVTETHTINPPGEIKNMSVSVIYNGELEAPMFEIISDHVESIVGIDADRGDKVSVAGIPFSIPNIDDENVNVGPIITKNEIYISLFGLLAVLLMFVIISSILRKKRKAKAMVAYEDEIRNDLASVYHQQALTGMTDQTEASKDQIAEVKDIFHNQTTTAVELLKVWLNDEKTEVTAQLDQELQLAGIEKVACLLIILGKEVTSNVIKHLNQEDVAHLVQVISSIRVVPKQRATDVSAEFLKLFEAYRFLAQGGYDFAKETLTRAMGTQMAEEILRKIKGSIQTKRPFDSLQRMDTQQLLNAIVEEHPQTIALVLCYLPVEKSAKIIAELPEAIQADVTQRIGLMSNTSSQIIEAVEDMIESRIQSIDTIDITQVGGLNTVVDILNSVDRSTQKSIINKMQESNEEFAEEIKNNLFVFEDIVQLDSVAIQRIIRDVDQATLALALKGTSSRVMEYITTNISARAAERLKEEISYLGPVRLAEVEKAQYEIINLIRKLEDAGELVISSGGDNDVIY